MHCKQSFTSVNLKKKKKKVLERSTEVSVITAGFISSFSPLKKENCRKWPVITAGLVSVLTAHEACEAPECFSLLTVQSLPCLPLIDPPQGRLWREKTTCWLPACHRLSDEKLVTMTTCECDCDISALKNKTFLLMKRMKRAIDWLPTSELHSQG